MKEFDQLMINKLGLYRIGDSGIYIKFPPHDNLKGEYEKTAIKSITLTLMLEDPIFNRIIENISEEIFDKTLSRMIDCFGNVDYIPISEVGKLLKEWLPEYGIIRNRKYIK